MRLVPLLAFTMVGAAFAGCFGEGEPDVPVALFEVTALEEVDAFQFDGSASKGSGLTYAWDFGDGTNGTGPVLQHQYEYTNGVYHVTLRVNDADGDLGQLTVPVTVGSGQNRAPEAAFGVTIPRAAVGEAITFDASATLDRDGDPLTYRWNFNHLIEPADYDAFRAQRPGSIPIVHHGPPAGDGHGHDHGDGGGHVGPSGAESRPDAPAPPAVPTPMRAQGGDHGPSGPDRNPLYVATVESPARVVQHAYPEPGLYFVRLQAVDIKGESGEEIWPMLVEASPPPRSHTRSTPGNLAAGSLGNQDATPSDPSGQVGPIDEAVHEITLDFPATYIQANLTWAPGGVDPSGATNAKLELHVTAADGTAFSARDDTDNSNDGRAPFELLSGIGAGKIEFKVVLVQGMDVDYTLEVYAKLDTNPYPDGTVGGAAGGDPHAGH